MTLHDARYQFEHKFLPGMFFEHPEALITLLLDDASKLCSIIGDIFDYAKIENPYSPDDFKAEPVKIDENNYAIQITLPEPFTEPLSYFHYIFFDIDFKKTAYFCLEKGNDFFGKEEPFLCGWDSDHNHLNFGNCPLDEKIAFLRCLELFMPSKYMKE